MNFASAAVVEVVRYAIADFGADLDSTTVTKLEGHAELVADLVNSLLHIYSCQRRQLRPSSLIPASLSPGSPMGWDPRGQITWARVMGCS